MKKNIVTDTSTIERFSPTHKEGLTSYQVEMRQEQGLLNTVKKKYSKSYLSIFLDNVCTFFNLLGLIVCIALIIAKAPIANFMFVVVFLCNIFIGIIQEIRAKKCVERLSLLSSKKIKVVRDGEVVEIIPDHIVLDDVVYLGIGSQIPTDCEVIDGEVEVNESLLTGESVPIKKVVGDELKAGSFIVSGTCFVRAVKVGKDNYVEQLSAKAKQYKRPHSELMGSLQKIIKGISIIIVPIATAFMIKSLAIAHDPYDKAINGTAQIVIGMIPSGMFLLTSLALAVGIIKLATHNTLVQDLYSLEMLARVDTICFDKTGTITDGNMSVKEVIDLSPNNYNTLVGAMLGALKDENQTAVALKNYFGENESLNAKEILNFNSARKLSAVTFENGKTFAFGAPEFVLNKTEFLKVSEQVNSYAKQGLRVLVLASSDKSLTEDFIPDDFTPLSLIVIEDNIREDAIQTIEWFKQNNVAIKVISGDNPVTVSEVSKRVGIEGAENYISLENLSDDEVYEAANKYTVFGRVSPDQKAILVKAMKAAGHTTAMTGDGVNDILALKEADCAITVASGSDAARNVSHIVLLDNNFNSMPKVVYEGRRVINNVQGSASLFLMKTLFNMFMAIIMLAIPEFSTSPFKLSSMNLLEIFVIGIPSFFLALQPNDALVEGKFIRSVLTKSLPSALLILINVIGVHIFGLCFNSSLNNEPYTTAGIFALTIAGAISLSLICKPFNLYRTILFAFSSVCILTIVVIAIFFGFELLALAQMISHWQLLLFILGLALIDLPLLLGLQFLCGKIKLPDLKKKQQV
ncbi:MAG: HAD family hydrolase [Clostridiales bacterium]|nr:HAD family hydrolase [Clostridiales bacterium]